jgi:phosphoacetylglucosamine mutase
MSDWYGLYSDLPNLQMKVKVNDKNSIKPCYNETEVIEPKGMQDDLNALMKKYPGSRTFVRPSGTEDVVRIYLEGAQDDLEPMTKEVVSVIQKYNK